MIVKSTPGTETDDEKAFVGLPRKIQI